MQQAQELQEKLQEIQQELERLEIEGEAGAGLVRVKMSGLGAVHQVKIDPSLLKPEEQAVLEELVAAALNDAQKKAREAKEHKIGELTASLPMGLSGFNLPF